MQIFKNLSNMKKEYQNTRKEVLKKQEADLKLQKRMSDDFAKKKQEMQKYFN
ncbi:hypothetical protein Q3V38_08485 [Limosilactobacillus fermentum]|uniref:hypothetical protein n=1 Tax=Limosilactobacillus fermentum TaxID=1613 RepID=UPI000ACB2A74|nr:hypothetical protein [Limosilactobacillus fermentum]MCL3984958.1 hypothetical protein [Limosilactobacillus fermentum]QZY76977.1 hypothetical protein K7X51_02710 [Limosilactobacillus fermentum]WLF74843.1 hypothetical protein Q3V38_08485 [Limosilactobacillus fermentum]